MNYANLFAPVTTEVTAALGVILPIALGIFGLVTAIRLGARLLTEFTGGDDHDDAEEG